MPKIQVLDRHTAELIAAGEVVERPSSVVKELMENSMDAGATSISVAIENGGIVSIGVTDNGEGMAREDVPVAFRRHATSKVRSADDLDAITTLGFRGEALASIAAVSRVEVVTRRKEDLAGTRYTLCGGEPGELEDCGCPAGMTITVRDLFYNVPARMKFLKKDVSEGNAVAAVVDKLALSRPDVAFHFTRDGRKELSTPGNGDLKGCIYSVLGKDFAKSLLPVNTAEGGISVSGYISSPHAPRANRAMQHVFINRRYVRSRTVTAALEQAYKGSLMSGRFPSCVLFLSMPAETVDANVHPAKVEIRFLDERPVFQAVYRAVTSALEKPESPKAVSLPFRSPPDAVGTVPRGRGADAGNAADAVDTVRVRSQNGVLFSADAERGHPLTVADVARRWGDLQQASRPEMTTPAPEPPSPAIPEVREETPVRYIGEVFDTYLLAEMGDALYIIDKHAAHERLIYNQLKSGKFNDSQQLLSPLPVTLGKDEYAALMQETEILRQTGFELEAFGGSEILVRAVPMLLADCDIQAALQEIAGGFLSGDKRPHLSKIEWIYHSTACRAAVKAGDVSHPEELELFARRILENDDLRTCPHGRPVCVSVSRKSIEKPFGRLG